VGVSAAAGALQARGAEAAQGERAGGAAAETFGPQPQRITLRVNGQAMHTDIDPATTLMETLRWRFQMTGTKEVCDRGSCGACSVLVDGKLVCSCMMLAVDAEGAEITTIEGLAEGDTLDPVQEAFIKHDALQCGYCTPGLVMAARALLNENPKPSLDAIKKGLSGNLCRCGTYTNIFNAVLEASGQSVIRDSEA
jgi:aerobic-type carbon monoxide dehydrogenase small subunit (CoxS/CutS family)